MSAWLLVRMLSGQSIPGMDAAGFQLQMQTHALGWDIDDQLISASADGPRLAISSKAALKVTASGLPADFLLPAWRQWQRGGPLRQGTGGLAMASRGRHAAFEATWADIKLWCREGDAVSAVAKIKASAKHKKIFESIRKASADEGGLVDEATVVALIRHLQVLPFDFQLEASQDTSDTIARCRGLLRSEGLEEARKLWEALVQRAERARLAGGIITLPGLWRELSRAFGLKDHPDFGASWRALKAVSDDYLTTIETALPFGSVVARIELGEKLGQRLVSDQSVVVHGESGTGKSALVRTTLCDKFPGWSQVWLGPEQLELAVSEARRAQVGLSQPLLSVLHATTRASNVLVVDSAERLTPDGRLRCRKLIGELLASNEASADPVWRAMIIGQTEMWSSGSLNQLIGAPVEKSVEVGRVSAGEVRAALRSRPSLAWLALHDDALAALGNLRALAWVMQAEGAFQAQDPNLFSFTAVADRLWEHWTGGEARFQNLLIRLAEREANFERSFAIGELDIGDAQAFDACPPEVPLRRNARHRIEFAHDLAADWTRFQRLKEIAHDVPRWSALAKNPLWHGALRMLGQYLLREPANGGKTQWDDAFGVAEDAKDTAPLAADVLLDALCLDPLAEYFLTERADMLFADHGARLNRLLARFHHIATVPVIPAGMLASNPDLELHLEAKFRDPIYGRWPALVRFLANHKGRVAAMISPVVAKVCETWLTRTPIELRAGTPMPFRRELAEIALVSAREMQVAQLTSTIFGDRSEPAVYSAALVGAADLPDEVASWALEMARRRDCRNDVTERVKAHRRQEAENHAERMRTDAAYRERQEQKRGMHMSLSVARKLPPWPLGGKGRLDRRFRESCTHTAVLSTLMRVRPQVAAEVVLAAIIEDSPEEDTSSHRMIDDDFGLGFDSESYPTAYWKSPFFAFLQTDADTALATLLQLVDFCTERWAHVPGKRGAATPPPPGVTVTVGDGQQRKFVGNVWVFDWPQNNSNRSGQLHCALAALEFWLCHQIDTGRDMAPIIERLLAQSNSASVLGVLVNVGKHKRDLFKGVLRPLLASRLLYQWDDWRVEKSGPHHFDAFTWARQGEAVFQMARQWVQAPYRQVTLRRIAVELIVRDAEVAAFVSETVQKWDLPADAKESLECRLLAAELDAKNYMPLGDGRSTFAYPDALQSDLQQYQDATQPRLQTLTAAYQCDRILGAAGQLSAEQAAALADMLHAIPADASSEEDTKRSARVAIAATLMVKAVEWLDANADCRAEVEGIVLDVVSAIGETSEALRHLAIAGSNGDLTFATHAVMHRWIQGGDAGRSWEAALLRLLTSRDRQAPGRAMQIAYVNRAQLGARWWRILQMMVLWSGLSMLSPDYDDEEDVQPRWERWLLRLRSRRLDGVVTGPESIDPVAVAQAVERLERGRWVRADPKKRGYFRRPATVRHSQGLDTQILGNAFAWLVGPRSAAADGGRAELQQDRKLLLGLWRFEVWRHEDNDDDGDHRLPSDLGYAVLEGLAAEVGRMPAKEAGDLWRPVLSLGPDWHHAIEHFLNCWLGQLTKSPNLVTFVQNWKAMLDYVLAASDWTKGRHWYYGERLIRQLLGFGFDHAFTATFEGKPLVLQAEDQYRRWANEHLQHDEDNVAGLCGFLGSDAGKPLRLEGLQWLTAALQGESGRWYRERVGSALLDFLDTFLTQETDKLAGNAVARGALVDLAALLVARQVPNAMPLHARIQRLR